MLIFYSETNIVQLVFKMSLSATTLVFPHKPAALDYEMKHTNLKIFVTPPSPQVLEVETMRDLHGKCAHHGASGVVFYV